MDLIHSIKVFVKVAEFGSFTKAAEALQIGRPQVTLTVRDLEDSIGARLFHRTTRQVSLTAEGEVFYERAREILGSVTEATTMFGRSGGPLKGKLRIDIPSAFAQTGLMLNLREFALAFPDIELVLGVTDRAIDMVAEGVDCVLRIGDLKDSSMVARRIGAAVMVTCASPRYLAEVGQPETLEELADHRVVSFLSGSSKRPLPWHFLVDGKDKTISPRSAILVNDSHAYVECGVADFGIIQVPGILVDGLLGSGRLKEVLQPFRPLPRPVSVVYPSKRYLAPQVRVFVDWIHQNFSAIDEAWLRPTN